MLILVWRFIKCLFDGRYKILVAKEKKERQRAANLEKLRTGKGFPTGKDLMVERDVRVDKAIKAFKKECNRRYPELWGDPEAQVAKMWEEQEDRRKELREKDFEWKRKSVRAKELLN